MKNEGNKNQPKVSVIIPLYNQKQFVGDAINSILGQTFKDFKFLIINDGSTDKAEEILKGYNDPRIRIINNEKNIGLTKSLNKGLKMAESEYIARMDADDVSMPERLEKEVLFLGHNKNIALVGTYYYMINEKGKILDTIKPSTKSEEIKCNLLNGNQFGHVSVMFRVECIKEVGYYREELGPVEDYDLWLRISDRYNIANIPEPLYKWRLNIKSISVTKKALQDKYALLAIELAKERRKLGKDKLQYLKKEEIDKLLNELFSSDERQNKKETAKGYFSYGLFLLNRRDYKGSLKLLLKSFIIHPLCIKKLNSLLKTLIILLLPVRIIKLLKILKRSIRLYKII